MRRLSDILRRNSVLSEHTQTKVGSCSTPGPGRMWNTGGTKMEPGSGKLMLTIIVSQAKSAPAMANLSHLELGEHSLCLSRFTSHPRTDKYPYLHPDYQRVV